MDRWIVRLYLIFFVVLIIWLVFEDDGLDAELKNHCELVKIYEQSGGEFGRPNYNGADCGEYND